jgi:serine/tyrosine/threonine adenylyltransferase
MAGFSNRFTQGLAGDTVDADPRRPRQVFQAAWSPALPTPVSAPAVLAWNASLADEMGLSVADTERAAIFSGNRLMPGMQPYAACYGGHQFGHWAGQLGDGRVVNLGEWQGPDARHWTLQLKGAGPTPYSRHADGRAVLRSSVREYLCSEFMHHLGIPTTRALSLVITGDQVVRDMFYDGNPQAEPGAIVCRVASSFIRFGHFELPAARGDIELLRALVRFTITTEWPDLAERLDTCLNEKAEQQIYLEWYQRVCDATLDLVVHWMRVGFVHGVMNTDNLSVAGLTIDYGPYGWIDDYDPDWTPNTTDAGQRRYCFGKQGEVACWNLYKLANALFPLIKDAEALQAMVDAHTGMFERRLRAMMACKLGVPADRLETSALLELLDRCLRVQETDMTVFFRALSEFGAADQVKPLHEVVQSAFYDGALLVDNLPLYQQLEAEYRLLIAGTHATERVTLMNQTNPCYVLRNYLCQQAIDALMADDRTEFDALLTLIRQPYQPHSRLDRYAGRRPDWARQKPGCSMLSCSS